MGLYRCDNAISAGVARARANPLSAYSSAGWQNLWGVAAGARERGRVSLYRRPNFYKQRERPAPRARAREPRNSSQFITRLLSASAAAAAACTFEFQLAGSRGPRSSYFRIKDTGGSRLSSYFSENPRARCNFAFVEDFCCNSCVNLYVASGV